jgi:DNA processing protein
MIFEDEEELFSRMALTQVDGIGPQISKTLIAYCGSAKSVFREKSSILRRIPEIGKTRAESISKFNQFLRVEKEMDFIERNQIEALSYTNHRYPDRLKQCYDCPVVIYKKGKIDLNQNRIISIVGTRNATSYGKKITQKFVKDFQYMDVVLVSGLAYGTDINAQKECIKLNIPTISVFAHGLDIIYPRIHQRFAEQMLDQGGWVTEYMSGTIPDRENFPKRNRIIAGVCDAVLVVEATNKGGALITAEYANSYNRDVFAIPGDLHSKTSEGCNTLIKSHKAALAQSVKDIRYVMNWDVDKQKQVIQKSIFHPSTKSEQLVFDFLNSNGKTGLDEISIRTKLSSGELVSLLLGLELNGIVKSSPGKQYEIV